jgi:hypothetical protein
MSLHDNDLKAKLARFLNRKSPPRLLDGKPDAQADETLALLAVLRRCAPRDPDALQGWWAAFEPALSESCGRMWPTEKEISAVAREVSAAVLGQRKGGPDAPRFDPAEQAGRRMANGEPVGESWLYGVCACELIARGLVDRQTMTAYRSGAYHARRDAYGKAQADAWEDEAKQRHDEGRALWAAREAKRAPRDTAIPDKTSPAKNMAAV